MKTPQAMLKRVGKFLVNRCLELGYPPLITKIPPPNRTFEVQPSEEAVFVKLFGNFNYNINTVHAKFGVLDPKNLRSLGDLGDENLSLTEMDKYLLVMDLLDFTDKQIVRTISNVNNLEELYQIWKDSENAIID